MTTTTETIEIEITIDTDDIEITKTGWSNVYNGGLVWGTAPVKIGRRNVNIPVAAYTRSPGDNVSTPHTRHWVMGADAIDFDGAHEAIEGEGTGIYQIVSRGRIHEIAEMATDAFLDVVEEATNDHDNDDHEALVELIRRAKEKAEEAE